MTGWDGPEGDDIVEQGEGGPPRWLVAARRLPGPGWFPQRRWRPSRGALILGAAGLVLGLVAGYAAGARPSREAALAPRAAPAARAVPAVGSAPAAASGSLSSSGSAPTCGPGFASGPPIAWPAFPTGQDGRELIRFCVSSGYRYAPSASAAVGQTTGACSVQLGHEVQLGIEVSNQESSDVTLQRVAASLPLSGGLRPVSWAWGPCGALSSGAGQVAEDLSGGEDLSPGESGWFTVTVRVLVKCPVPYPVQFVVQCESAGRTSFAQLPGFSDLSQVPYSGCTGQ